jgi:hypothetical protein
LIGKHKTTPVGGSAGEVCSEHRDELDAIVDPGARLNRLCELNVIRQVKNVASDIIVQAPWARVQNRLGCFNS